MNPKTGEIKKFAKEGSSEPTKDELALPEKTKTKTFHKIPKDWVGLPMPGFEVEVVVPPENKRGRTWKVIEIIEGKPGMMVLEPSLKTMKKGRKKL